MWLFGALASTITISLYRAGSYVMKIYWISTEPCMISIWYICKFIPWTLDISRFNITQHCTQHNKFEGKTSVRLRTHNRHPYLALTGELCVSVSRELFGEKWPRGIGSALYIYICVCVCDRCGTKKASGYIRQYMWVSVLNRCEFKEIIIQRHFT